MASITAPKHSKLLTLSDGTVYGYIKIDAQPGRPTLLFLRGYPSSSYHWLNQVKLCDNAGYGMIAPDMLGYGDSSKPVEISAYNNTILSDHIIEILDNENISRVVGVGHDWGPIMLSTLIQIHPKRFLLLVFLATGYLTSQAPFLDINAFDRKTIKLIGRPLLGYWLFHNKPEAASIVESSTPESQATILYAAHKQTWIDHVCPPGALEDWIRAERTTDLGSWVKEEEFRTHIKIMQAGGYTGPLNWYKQAVAGVTHSSEAKNDPNYASTKFNIPALFIGCEKDTVNLPSLKTARMGLYFNDLTIESLNSGHWVMLERPKDMWLIMQTWIEKKRRVTKL